MNELASTDLLPSSKAAAEQISGRMHGCISVLVRGTRASPSISKGKSFACCSEGRFLLPIVYQVHSWGLCSRNCLWQSWEPESLFTLRLWTSWTAPKQWANIAWNKGSPLQLLRGQLAFRSIFLKPRHRWEPFATSLRFPCSNEHHKQNQLREERVYLLHFHVPVCY